MTLNLYNLKKKNLNTKTTLHTFLLLKKEWKSLHELLGTLNNTLLAGHSKRSYRCLLESLQNQLTNAGIKNAGLQGDRGFEQHSISDHLTESFKMSSAFSLKCVSNRFIFIKTQLGCGEWQHKSQIGKIQDERPPGWNITVNLSIKLHLSSDHIHRNSFKWSSKNLNSLTSKESVTN